jgi:hypothetical protein
MQGITSNHTSQESVGKSLDKDKATLGLKIKPFENAMGRELKAQLLSSGVAVFTSLSCEAICNETFCVVEAKTGQSEAEK